MHNKDQEKKEKCTENLITLIQLKYDEWDGTREHLIEIIQEERPDLFLWIKNPRSSSTTRDDNNWDIDINDDKKKKEDTLNNYQHLSTPQGTVYPMRQIQM